MPVSLQAHAAPIHKQNEEYGGRSYDSMYWPSKTTDCSFQHRQRPWWLAQYTGIIHLMISGGFQSKKGPGDKRIFYMFKCVNRNEMDIHNQGLTLHLKIKLAWIINSTELMLLKSQ